MTVRDRVVRWTLSLGAVIALLAWHLAGPWASLVLVLLALGVAAAAYRVDAPRIDVEHPTACTETSADTTPAERVDQ